MTFYERIANQGAHMDNYLLSNPEKLNRLTSRSVIKRLRACLHGGGEPQVGEVTYLCGVQK